MIFAFVIFYWLASIILWIIILGLLRSPLIKKDISQVLSLILSVIFLAMVLKLSLFTPICYVVGGAVYCAFTWLTLPNVQNGWRRYVAKIIDMVFWPQSLCLTMFLYGASDEQPSA